MNSTFTFKDWLKQKVDSSLVKKTGTVGYVPSAIKKLGRPYLDVFKQLRYGKSDSFICKKLGLDLESYYGYYDQVEETLIDSGQIDLLRSPIVGSIDTSDQEGEENLGFQLEGEVAANPSIIPDYKYLESLIQNRPIININLDKHLQEFDFIKTESILSISNNSNVEKNISDLILDDELQDKLIQNGQKFVKTFLHSPGIASFTLAEKIKLIEESNNSKERN